MRHSDKLLLRDYVQSKDRMHPPRITEDALIVAWTKYVIAATLIVLMCWLLWAISGGGVQRLVAEFVK